MKLSAWLLLGFAAIAGLQSWRLANEQRAHADTRNEHAQVHADWQREARRATEAARAEERRRTAEVQKAADEADQARLVAEGHAVDARAAAERLRGQLATLAARLRSAPQHPATAVAGAGVEGADALDLLTGMLARHSGELVQVGEFADRLRIAGQTCERSYDALSP
ncbi:DUF2514 family protein [Hydrogenophaga sp. SNF1]|uniref:DUF2514 family protein n=1 Tax=Hydrogenophaga sp. SNF1 TaxID=3098762 RepID=UPI003A0FE695